MQTFFVWIKSLHFYPYNCLECLWQVDLAARCSLYKVLLVNAILTADVLRIAHTRIAHLRIANTRIVHLELPTSGLPTPGLPTSELPRPGLPTSELPRPGGHQPKEYSVDQVSPLKGSV